MTAAVNMMRGMDLGAQGCKASAELRVRITDLEGCLERNEERARSARTRELLTMTVVSMQPDAVNLAVLHRHLAQMNEPLGTESRESEWDR